MVRVLFPEQFSDTIRDVARDFYRLFYQVNLSEPEPIAFSLERKVRATNLEAKDGADCLRCVEQCDAGCCCCFSARHRNERITAGR